VPYCDRSASIRNRNASANSVGPCIHHDLAKNRRPVKIDTHAHKRCSPLLSPAKNCTVLISLLCACSWKKHCERCTRTRTRLHRDTHNKTCHLTCYNSGYGLQTKMRESHRDLWDVGIAESRNITRSFPNPAVLKCSIEQ